MNQIPSFVFRRRAMAAIKPVMQVLIVVALLAMLPGIVSYTVTLRTKASPDNYLAKPLDNMMDFLQTVDPEATLTEQEAQATQLLADYMAATQTFLQEKGALYFSMIALEMLLAPVMLVPLYGGLLNAVRKQEVSLPECFKRLRHGPKALLVYLWMMLRIAVWTLPGAVLMLAAGYMPLTTGMLTMLIGTVLSLVLGFRAALHYVLAPVVQVDQPSLSPNGCIRVSFQAMRTRKMEYFMLRISFALWMLLSSLITVMAISLFGGVIGMALSMMAELLLNVYVKAAVVCFYEAYVVKGEKSVDLQKELGMSFPDIGDDLN